MINLVPSACNGYSTRFTPSEKLLLTTWSTLQRNLVSNGQCNTLFHRYLLEQSFSVDNLFVFVLIFKYFKAPLAYQNRAFIRHRWCSNLSLVIDSSWNCNPSGISREILLSKNEQHEQAYLCCHSGSLQQLQMNI